MIDNPWIKGNGPFSRCLIMICENSHEWEAESFEENGWVFFVNEDKSKICPHCKQVGEVDHVE